MPLWDIAKEGIGLIVLIFFWIPFLGLGAAMFAGIVTYITGMPFELGGILFVMLWALSIIGLFMKHKKKG